MTFSNDQRQTDIGHRHTWGGSELFGLRDRDRRHHAMILGQTGTGKSTLLKNIAIADIQSGAGLSLIDPHGDLADDVLQFVPPNRIQDVVLFSPSDLEFPVAYNLLAGGTPDSIHLMTSGIVSSMRAVWAASWGPRMEFLLTAAIAALIECCQKTANVSLLALPRMLTDDRFREWVLSHVSDEVVLAYWKTEFDRYDPRLRSEIISPVQNKIGALLMSVPIRLAISQVRKSFDFRYIMDHGKIFVANLAKGRIGEDKAKLLGALLVSQFEQAALSRADIPLEERRDHFLLIDEVQNYVSESVGSMLSENRKFRLNMVLACQFTSQLSPEVRDAIFGNCGTLVSFRVGEKDGEILSREYGRVYPPEQFVDLPNFEVLVKLLDNGRHGEPFRGTTLPPVGRFYGRKDTIISRSRERYATPRKEVEDKLRQWMKE
jgi:type IV secretory pathway TraG/TraD family ATPase VirD4